MTDYKSFEEEADAAQKSSLSGQMIWLDPDTDNPTIDEMYRLYDFFKPIADKWGVSIKIHFDRTTGLSVVSEDKKPQCLLCDKETTEKKICKQCVDTFIEGISWDITPERSKEIADILSKD